MNRVHGGISTYNWTNSGTKPAQQLKQQPAAVELGYLTQTVASILEMLSHNNAPSSSSIFRRTKLFVCNVELVPDRFREPEELKDLVETVTRYGNSNWTHHSQDIFERAKEDYIYCLKQAVTVGTITSSGTETPPRYVMLVEDDVIFDRRVLDVLSAVLRRQSRDSDDERTSLVNNDHRWLFVKLYYPEKWMGYANEVDRVIELASVATVGGSIGVIVVSALYSTCRLSSSTRRPRSQTVVLFLLFAVYAALFCLGVGRPHARAWRSHLGGGFHRTVSSFDCSIQAVLYPTRVVDGLVRHLEDQRCTNDYAIDLAVAEYARLRRLKSYLVDPNLVRHIGFVSSVRQHGKRIADFLS